ncbi:MAG: TfuA-related McrA-glycine thioamidation protein [Methanomassiliicoccales archaeon]
MRAVIYVGPSLPHELARKILSADYRPPIKRGDLVHLYDEEDIVVGIIDGVFFSESAVGHREILELINRGIKVIGGGSMGALRASELCDFGMMGVGEIFRLYRSGVIEGDDEVALAFDPLTFCPLSEPLINIRHNLENAVAHGIISSRDYEELIKEIKKIYFPMRSYDLLKSIAATKLKQQDYSRFLSYLEENKKDLKRQDAELVVMTIKDLIGSL